MERVDGSAGETLNGISECLLINNGWDDICNALRGMVSHDGFQRWFGAAKWLGIEDDVASVSVPGEIHQVWIETNYLPELSMAVSGIFEGVREVKICLLYTSPSPRDGLLSRMPSSA